MEEQVLRVINYALGKKRATFGHGFKSAYHTTKIGGKEFRGQRDISKRFENIDYDFNDKVVVDFGCNMGGMLHHISDQIEYGVGIDYNSKVVNAANMISASNNVKNINFYTFNLDSEDVNEIDNFVLGKKVDVCFVLAIALWVKNWKKVVKYSHKVSDTLIYESNGKDEFQEKQREYLESLYSDVKLLAEKSLDDNRKDADAKRRMLFICRK
jgi:SAM-dependent methyltransferase